ncbi:hypothetical protein AMEX_G4398 [Astyanax mexicanus]|uniref:Uncharacterized protein n=1 Tax=Astyanax mexicanus TaxID=7994 RepID=A0A8T2M4F5_ASTMX|nr:hypothetical protein AMEX_G4398 [Astyanax mexicanus]
MDVSALLQKPIGTKVFVPRGVTPQCSRGKLGHGLFQKRQDFDLRDPKFIQSPLEYNSLHDEHLKSFFNQPRKKKQLIKLGLITWDEKVPCSLKEFNMYMDYQRAFPPKKQTPRLDQRTTSAYLPDPRKRFGAQEKNKEKKKEQLVRKGLTDQDKKAKTSDYCTRTVQPDDVDILLSIIELQRSLASSEPDTQTTSLPLSSSEEEWSSLSGSSFLDSSSTSSWNTSSEEDILYDLLTSRPRPSPITEEELEGDDDEEQDDKQEKEEGSSLSGSSSYKLSSSCEESSEHDFFRELLTNIYDRRTSSVD